MPYIQVLNSLTSGVLVIDAGGLILVANPAAARQLGVPPESLRPGLRLGGIAVAEALADLLAEISETGKPISRRELEIYQENEGLRILGVTASPMLEGNARNGAILLFADLTKVRQLEREAQLNRQLAAIGELTAGVVHELRNPLSVIAGTAELLARRLGEDHQHFKTVSKIIQEAEQLDRTIRHFLSFARPFELELDACRANEILDRVLQLTSHKAQSKRIGLSTSCAADVPVFAGDAAKIAQAIANIAANAIDIMDSGGEIWIEAACDAESAIFSIDDNGPGIHLKPGEDLFAPFFSKRSGGTGLGLAIVHRIVTAHKGKVTYANRDAGGAHFEMRIPLHSGEGR